MGFSFPATQCRRRRAFTLVELILVMVLLLVVVAISMPRLSGFFRGRYLDSEVNRFMALNRLAQTRAVSEGMPMTLWVDSQNDAYGLSVAAGYAAFDTNATEFSLHESLSVEFWLPEPQVETTVISYQPGLTARTSAHLAIIRYLPDGFMDPGSPLHIVFRQNEDQLMWLARHRSGRTYELQTNQLPARLP